ncbi:putative G-protein coupled receptor Mth-like 10 isoform X12 [Rhynchophorus ferrugineus]|uniref:putative G-protein coupled receptor Mth-like 10 isoform X12 n=1 Tax=Rhynchophorus ferrugineus TaxID=354439 RepID=UPI003FCD07DA
MGNLSIKRSFKMLRSLTPFLFVTLSVIWAVDNDVCDKKNCLQKCCDFNESRNQKGHCEASIFRHPFMNLANIHVVPKQRCREGEYAIYEPLDNIVYMENGSVSATDIDMIFHLDQYCFDHLDGIPGVFVCLSSDTVEAEKQHFIIYGMIISMPFLFITFLVYLILPDKNVHQYALMLYVLTLLLAYVLLVTINLSESLPTFFCTGAAYGTLFLFMVSFFWMNVICFDIWYTFSGGRGYIVSSRKSERKRFLIYTAYAVGIPILHVCIVALLDKYLDEESIHKPNIGIKKCFLDDGWPSLWYMYGEAAILVLINVVFFTLTALKIRQVKKETLMLKQNESKRHALEKEKRREIVTDFYRFNLFLKLFLAMGVNWTMEVISWLVNWQTTDKYTYIWYITDFINAVYGGVIFFIFVFKRKIWKMLQKRYYNFIGKPHLARAVTTTTDTRTSHYSSATDTNLTERTNITERRNNGIPTEELALRRA